MCSAVVLLDTGPVSFTVRFMWINQVPLDAALSWFAWRAARQPGIDRVVSRYLTTLTFAALAFLLGDLTQVALVLVDPGVERLNGGVAQSVLFLLGCAMLIYRLLRHPTSSTSTRGQRLRFYLDAVTVLAGGAVLIWWVGIDPAATTADELVGGVLVACTLLVVTFAAVKLVLSGNAPMTRAASTPMIVSAAVLGVSMSLAPSGAEPAEQPWLLVLRVVPSALITIGPRIQELQTRVNPVFHRERRVRPFNLTPYVAIAVTFGALVLALPTQVGVKVWGVVVGAVLVTALVVVRQVLALLDNFDLISRLDSTLLDLRGHQELLHEQATHDGLTGLANRAAFGEAVTAELGARLRDAVGTDQFFLEYQPVVDLHTGTVVGAEALVRWRPPGRPVVPPAEFVPTAERTGLIVPLGTWILRTACAELARWRHLSPAAAGLVMSVNVSGRQLQEPGLVDEVAAVLAATGLPADRLMIEVTETVVLDDDVVLDALHALRALSRQRAVATAVIQMARALDMGAVAEDVERPEQAELLRGLGYRRAQGYLYSAPLPGSEFTERWDLVAVGGRR